MPTKNKPPLILIDASGYVFRAYHVFQHQTMSDAKGRPTQVIYGVLNMLRSLRQKYPDSNIIPVFDGKGKELRAEWYPDYKANRPKTPEDLAAQIPPLQEILRAQGLPLVIGDRLEADDMIAHLCAQAPALYDQTYIVTRDKDLAQLVTRNILILADERKDEIWDAAAVKQKYGVPPERIVDYLSLVGDSSDNIPGVPKIGAKTAVALLNEHGSLDALIAQADKITGKIGENLRASLEQLPLIRKLNTLISECDPPLDLAALSVQPADTAKLRALYTDYGLRSFLRTLEEPVPDVVSYQQILHRDDWANLLKKLQQTSVFAFDLETTGLDHLDAKIVGFAFALTPKSGYYVPCGHNYMGAPQQLTVDAILTDLQPLFADAKKTIVAHNAKFDFHILRNHSSALPRRYDDTMLMAYVCLAGRRDLTSMSMTVLKRVKKDFTDIAGKGAKQLNFNEIDIQAAGDYAAEDADVCLHLWQALGPQLAKTKASTPLYTHMDKPLLPVLLDMERHGALLDTKHLARQSVELGRRITDLEKQIHALADRQFNINSPVQLQGILYDKLGLKPTRKTSGGQDSTAERVLRQLAKEHEMPRLILDYRNLSKLKNTYTDALPKEVNPRTGRVHTSFHQAAVATGRLSSVNPNLQNIPIRTQDGRRIRQAFIAPPGHVLASADYSQIELRIMAHLSNDQTLLNAFAKDMDIHQATAAEVFAVPVEQVNSEQRRKAKAINFGLIYGMSAFGLANQLQIDKETAQEYIELYFQRYPGVKDYMEETKQAAARQGWVTTLSGRKIYTPNIKSDNFAARQGAERAAINAPVQGTAADLIRLAMVAIAQQLDRTQAVMILQVHDELLFEIKEDALAEYKQLICDTMTAVQPLGARLKVKLNASFGYGNNWDAAH